MADKKITLATKCGCGESTTDLDYKDIASKCGKCGEQLQVASLFKGESAPAWKKDK